MVQRRSRKQKRSRQQRRGKSRSQRRSRYQRGGAWYNPLSWFSSEPQYTIGEEEEGIVDRVGSSVKSGLNAADSALANASTMATEGAQKLVEKTTEVLNTDVPLVDTKQEDTTFQPSLPTIMPSSTMGGRRRSRSLAKSRSKSRSRYLAKKGGRGVGVAEYAAPVEDVKIAQPTYMEKYTGGRRRRTAKRSRK